MIVEPIHFIGIGGIGMSAIAQALLEKGYRVTGSDLNDNGNTQRLQELGAKITKGHQAENIQGAQTVVISTAVKPSNPELQAAQKDNLKILHRSEMLVEVMASAKERICIAGTHGKTSMTTMMAALFEAANVNPTVINGGIMNAYGSNTKIGADDYFIVEADESDGSFTRFAPTVAVVSNIDPEHMDHYGSFESLMEAFSTFITNAGDQGHCVLGIDHPNVRALVDTHGSSNVTTYGISENAQLQATNIQATSQGMSFDVDFNGGRFLTSVYLKAYGEHNVLNALATIATAKHYGFDGEKIKEALANFQGVQRRFTPVGNWNGVTIIDDYAHHPVEIEATLGAARKACKGNVIAVLQPHRYTRLQHHFQEFANSTQLANQSFVMPVFAAGEDPIIGSDSDALVHAIQGQAELCTDIETLTKRLKAICSPGDMVVCMGAGNITMMARELAGKLEAVARSA